MNPSKDAEIKPITKKEIFKYSIGGFGVNILNGLIAAYAIYFMTDIGGLSVAAAGIVTAAATIFDAVTDPLMGAMCDRTVTKMGRYRPYMLYGAFVMAMGALLFFVKAPFEGNAKAVYYILTYCLYKLGETMVIVPYHAGPAILSGEKAVRNRIVTWSKLLAGPATLLTSYAHRIVAGLGSGNEARGWLLMTLVFTAPMLISLYFCSQGMKRFDTRERAEKAVMSESGERLSLGEIFASIKGNKALFCLILAFGTNCCADRFISSNQSYYAKYLLQDMKFVSRVGVIGILVTFPVFLLFSRLTRRFSKRYLFIAATLIQMAGPAIMLIGRNAYSFKLALAAVMLVKIGGYACNILMFMMLPDCVDYGFKLTGIAAAGLVTSFIAFAGKLSAALGNVISTALLDSAGYAANEVQTPRVLAMMITLMTIPVLISDICSIAGMIMYPIRGVDGKIKKSEQLP